MTKEMPSCCPDLQGSSQSRRSGKHSQKIEQISQLVTPMEDREPFMQAWPESHPPGVSKRTDWGRETSACPHRLEAQPRPSGLAAEKRHCDLISHSNCCLLHSGVLPSSHCILPFSDRNPALLFPGLQSYPCSRHCLIQYTSLPGTCLARPIPPLCLKKNLT